MDMFSTLIQIFAECSERHTKALYVCQQKRKQELLQISEVPKLYLNYHSSLIVISEELTVHYLKYECSLKTIMVV